MMAFAEEASIPSPAVSSSHQAAHDFEEQAALLRGWNQDYAQISSGTFSGYVSEIQFDDVHLFLEYTSQALFQSGQLGEDVIAVGVPLSAQGQGMFCGGISDQDAIHVFSGDEGFEFFSPHELVMGGIAINRIALLDTLTPQEQQQLHPQGSHACVKRIDQTKIQAMRSFMSGAFQLFEQSPQFLQNPFIIQALRAAVSSVLEECLIDHGQITPETLSASKCWNIVAASRELVRGRSDTPVTVAELCRHLGVSRRTLQYCFHNLLDTNPVAYLRAERLNGVRRMLRHANSVTEAAAHWGFWHFGHFSQEYKKMFGELPSTTFKRLHSLN
jgi:AraC family ethanolamine operon transcriptional activator